jgi:hypothetical protein
MKALSESGASSSMRIALLTVIILSALLVLAMVIYILISVNQSKEIDWSGLSLLLGAIGVFLTPAFTGKAIQKKFETDARKTDPQ